MRDIKVKRRPTRKERPQSKTFDKVLTAFYKRPSEQLGTKGAILVDKYRHESVVDIDEDDDGYNDTDDSSRLNLKRETSTPSLHDRKISPSHSNLERKHHQQQASLNKAPSTPTSAMTKKSPLHRNNTAPNNNSFNNKTSPSSPKYSGMQGHGYSNSVTVQSTIRDESNNAASFRLRSKSNGDVDDWDLYEHSESKGKDTLESDQEPVACCIIS